MRHGSLFSGIGGFDLAAEWMGWENVFHCEWNPFGQKILNHYWPNAKAMTTLLRQTSLFTEEKLTFLPEDSLASHTHRQESERVKRMSATCGRKCLEQLGKFSQVGSLGKTFLGYLIGTGEWCSQKSRLTWKVRGLKFSHLVYCQLVAKMLRTDETDFGLWPTPMLPGNGGINGKAKMKKMLAILPTPDCSDRRSDKSSQWGLTNYAKNGMLPTPTAMDSTGATANMKSTQVKEGSMHSMTLSRVFLPTPATMNYKGARSTEALEASGRTETNSLPDFFNQTGKSSQLNPRFVAEMMGYPPNWLELPFLNTGTNQ